MLVEKAKILSCSCSLTSQNGSLFCKGSFIEKHFAKAKARLNVQDSFGETALMYAAKSRQCQYAGDQLLILKADLDVQEKNGRTALMMAAWAGNATFVQKLVDFGACVDKRDKAGCTALIDAAIVGVDASIKLLIEKMNPQEILKDIEYLQTHKPKETLTWGGKKICSYGPAVARLKACFTPPTREPDKPETDFEDEFDSEYVLVS